MSVWMYSVIVGVAFCLLVNTVLSASIDTDGELYI